MPNESFLTVLSPAMADMDALVRRRQGFWLRVAREAKGVGQKEAAAACGLSTKAAISDYEAGITQVPQHRLRRLADFYGWPLVMFTEPEETAEEQAEGTDGSACARSHTSRARGSARGGGAKPARWRRARRAAS